VHLGHFPNTVYTQFIEAAATPVITTATINNNDIIISVKYVYAQNCSYEAWINIQYEKNSPIC